MYVQLCFITLSLSIQPIQKTGDTYAVKISNQLGMMRPLEVRRREFEVLNKLNHENIVKLFASETEVSFICFRYNLFMDWYYFKALKGLVEKAENMAMKTASILFYLTFVILFVPVCDVQSLISNVYVVYSHLSPRYIRRLEEILNNNILNHFYLKTNT